MRSAVELFVGAGGLGMGVTMAGFKTIMAVEWDHWACETVRLNQKRGLAEMAGWPIVEADVRLHDYSIVTGDVDLVVGGPPCQPFSMGGRHASHFDLRDMFPEAITAVRMLRPKAFMFENVKGLARSSFSEYLNYICHSLSRPDIVADEYGSWTEHMSRLRNEEAAGKANNVVYDVSAAVLNAADYGVPQRRERLFIVGLRNDLGASWTFPDPTHTKHALMWEQWRSGDYWLRHDMAPILSGENLRNRRRAARLDNKMILNRLPWNTVRDALKDLPDPELEPDEAFGHHDHDHVPGARSYKGHTGSPPDMPAKTLKAGVHGVPGGENMLRREDGTVRYFTVREAGRLQTFPDKIHFEGSWGQVMRQLGNAVPTELSRVLAERLKDTLDRAEAKPKAASEQAGI